MERSELKLDSCSQICSLPTKESLNASCHGKFWTPRRKVLIEALFAGFMADPDAQHIRCKAGFISPNEVTGKCLKLLSAEMVIKFVYFVNVSVSQRRRFQARAKTVVIATFSVIKLYCVAVFSVVVSGRTKTTMFELLCWVKSLNGRVYVLCHNVSSRVRVLRQM